MSNYVITKKDGSLESSNYQSDAKKLAEQVELENDSIEQVEEIQVKEAEEVKSKK